MALFYVLQKISIPNYPAKFFWVNLMPFVNVNVDSYLPCGSRLKNEVLYQLARFPVFVLGVYFHCIHVCCDENASGHHHYNKMQLSDGNYSSRRVIKSIRSPNRTNRPNQQTCKGHCH